MLVGINYKTWRSTGGVNAIFQKGNPLFNVLMMMVEGVGPKSQQKKKVQMGCVLTATYDSHYFHTYETIQ